ncbi:ABC transporter substrate-binding protein [Photobacterium nomapromontoriensis]|uniref:ABC transporter substrate-binding protein n=1 Tax=Photobacterium nomapromontoriensis TaxID=2910237 RepID=UPI003D0FCD61
MKRNIKSFVFTSLFTSALFSFNAFSAQFPVTVTDVAGRHITIDHQPENVALSVGRIFPVLEILYQQDAAKHLVAWGDDMRISAPSMYANYSKAYPSLLKITTIGKIKSGEFDVESFINLPTKPDLFIVDLSSIKIAQDKGLLDKLERAGINVIAIDFKEDPLNNTVSSINSLSKALGREQEGNAFTRYYQAHVDHLKSTVSALPESEKNKRVFIERAAGYGNSCCRTFATGNMGTYIPFLHAINVADKPLKGAITGNMSPETVIVSQPDVYIMLTTGWIDKNGNPSNGIPLGYAPTKTQAISQATSKLMDRHWMQALSSYQSKNIYSIYMPFYNSPYNLIAMEYFAKWIHPEQFKSLHPEHTFEEMHSQFTGRAVSGTFGQQNSAVMK